MGYAALHGGCNTLLRNSSSGDTGIVLDGRSAAAAVMKWFERAVAWRVIRADGKSVVIQLAVALRL